MPAPLLKEYQQNRTAFVEQDVVVIGAGISGICLSVLLLQAGIKNVTIIEKGAGFGGTWRDNRYPGCRCDIPAHLYSFSFATNPKWSRVFPAQSEILEYLEGVAEKYNLHKHCRLGSEVESAQWDDRIGKWRLTIRVLGGKESEYAQTYTMLANFLVSAVGQLNQPQYPTIPGLGGFKGQRLHSARWDLSQDLRGKRVAIVGTGATAIQILPEISEVVSQVTIYQRTPTWIMPKEDEFYTSSRRLLLEHLPPIRKLHRASLMDSREAFQPALINMSSAESDWLRQMCLAHMSSQLPGREDLWKKLTPTYAPGCKRIVISNDYFPALLRDNVRVEDRDIKRVTATGILSDKEEPFDIIVLATGFKSKNFLESFGIRGKGGRSIQDIWAKTDAQALYGATVEGLPNFAMLYGPNTNLSHTSVILMIEAQARYITALAKEVIQARREGGALTILPKPARVREYNDEIRQKLGKTTLADTNCRSWYKTDDGHITNNWHGTATEYQRLMSTVDWSDFELEGAKAAKLASSRTYIGQVEEGSRYHNWQIGTWAGLGCIGAIAVAGFSGLRIV